MYSLVDALAERVAEKEAEKQDEVLGDIEAKKLFDALSYMLAEGEADRKDETLGDMEAETLVKALANTRIKDGGRDTKRHSDLFKVNAEGLVDVVERIAEGRPRH